MSSKFRSFFRFFSRPPVRPDSKSAAFPASVLAAVAMSTYSSTIAKGVDPGPLPDDAGSKPHHIHKQGRTVGFKNVHPSNADGVHLTRIFKSVVW